jgi:hypothetical protein
VVFVVLSGALIGLSVTAIHELGHVIVGFLVGFRCSSMFIGPLQLHVPFRVALHPDRRAWLHGGASLFPVVKDRLRARGIAMVLAGPAANLLSGCALLLLPYEKGFFSGLFIVASIVAGVVELLVPLRGPTFVFDGRRILTMLRHPELGERWLALMRLGADARNGVLPEAMPADFLAMAIAVRDESAETVAGHAFAYSSAFHQKRDSEAARMLETCLAHSSHAAPAVREALLSDAAVFQARRRKRADLAAQWLDAIPTTTPNRWFRSRAEAAILEANGDVDGAMKSLAEGEAAALALPAGPQREAQLRLLQRWRSELGARPS